MVYTPTDRISAKTALSHPYFAGLDQIQLQTLGPAAGSAAAGAGSGGGADVPSAHLRASTEDRPKKCDDEMGRLLGLWSSRLTVDVPIWMTTASEERLRHIDDIEEGLFATMATLEASHNIDWGDFSPDAVSPDVWKAIVATYRLYRQR
jgi:hypothetical protein